MDGSGDDSTSNKSSNGNITRWNPTKEQVSILEGLYGQGMRTPTADQIQCITSRLRAYGHIEGKNVFYWFQNHKARQRQKEKEMQQQQSCLSFSYLNHRCLYFHNRNAVVAPGLLYRPVPSPSATNVVYRPYYVVQNEVPGDNCASYPKDVPPSVYNRRPRLATVDDHPHDNVETAMTMPSPFCYSPDPLEDHGHLHVATIEMMDLENNDKATLDLFPVRPSSIDHGPRTNTSSMEDYSSFTEKCGGGDLQGQPFFDFLSVNRYCGQG